MKKYNIASLLVVLTFFSACHISFERVRFLDSTWDNYCRAVPNTNLSEAKLENELVQKAQKKLAQCNPEKSLLNYIEFYKLYPQKYRSNSTDLFLNILCSEYRDNPALLKAKLEWFSTIEIIQKSKEHNEPNVIFDQALYHKFLVFTKELAQWRIKKAQHNNFLLYAESFVPVLTECEFNFILRRWLASHQAHLTSSLHEEYEDKLSHFRNECSLSETNTALIFRGDGYLKPRTPESNAMDLHGRSLWWHCMKSSTSQCKEYFLKPFQYRYNLAQSSLDQFLNIPVSIQDIFNDNQNFTIITPSEETNTEKTTVLVVDPNSTIGKMLDASLSDLVEAQFKKQNKTILRSIQGKIFKLIDQYQKAHTTESHYDSAKETAFISIQKSQINAITTSLERSTLFDQVYFVDVKNHFIGGGYSPFVTASMYPDASHKFTFQGHARGHFADNTMHWLSIFRVPIRDIRTKHDLLSEGVLFHEYQWLIEPSFNTDPLAADERTIVRIGSPESRDLWKLLYLGMLDPIDKNLK